jgi:hypothetical protein
LPRSWSMESSTARETPKPGGAGETDNVAVERTRFARRSPRRWADKRHVRVS